MGRALALAAVILALLLSGCSDSSKKAAPRPASPPSQTLAPSTRLIDLEHPARSPALFSLFNAEQGVPRLVLLVSPT